MDVGKLSKLSVFSKLSKEEASSVAGLFEKKVYKAGETLSVEGEPQSKAFIIESGEVRRLKRNPESHEQVELEKLSSGDNAGFLHIFGQDPCFATIQSVGDATVWELSHENFSKWVLAHAEAGFALLQSLAHQVRAQSKVIHSLGKGDGQKDGVLRVIFYETKKWVVDAFDSQKKELGLDWLEIKYVSQRLSIDTAIMASGFQAVCCFVNDTVDANVTKTLSQLGVKLVALRCAGFDRVDLKMTEALGLTVARVPAYSPYAVAEHAIALLLTLNRKTHKAYNRTREGNFGLDGLLGTDLYSKTAGVVGTGKIGQCLVNILLGFGCKVLCYDVFVNKELAARPGVTYVDLDTLFQQSDFISLHAPLTEQTKYMVNAESLKKMKKNCILINTSRGALVDTKALVEALEKERIAGAGLDVYEGEKDYFFQDKSIEDKEIADDTLRALLALKNVILTGHQAFFTSEAVNNIAKTTLENIKTWKDGKQGRDHPNAVHA